MRPHAAAAAIAVFMLAAGARAYADPASTPAPAASAQSASAQSVSAQTGGTASVPNEAVAAEARAAKAMASQAIATLDATAAQVRTLLRKARARGMRDEIACVDEGLSRADVAMRNAREDAVAAQNAYAQGNVVDARKANDRVARARDNARIAASAASACIQPPARTSGTQVRVVMDAPGAHST
jgi:hypothetical protein